MITDRSLTFMGPCLVILF